MATKTINQAEIQKTLGGLSFPTKKQDLIMIAKSKGASSEVISALNGLPDMSYNSIEDVMSQLED